MMTGGELERIEVKAAGLKGNNFLVSAFFDPDKRTTNVVIAEKLCSDAFSLATVDVPKLCKEVRRLWATDHIKRLTRENRRLRELIHIVEAIAKFEHWHIFPPREICMEGEHCRCAEKARVAELLKELKG